MLNNFVLLAVTQILLGVLNICSSEELEKDDGDKRGESKLMHTPIFIQLTLLVTLKTQFLQEGRKKSLKIK